MRLTRITILMCVAAASNAMGQVNVRIGDVTHLKGQSVNRLIGTGLVVGLNGTGDGDQYAVTMRQLAQALGNLAAPVGSPEELKNTKNVAVVMVDAVIPENGVREGDQINVNVSSIGSAKSLAGGRLLITPLMYHDLRIETIYAFASGKVQITDPTTATVGVVEDGAKIEEDVLLGFTARGSELPFANNWVDPREEYITLILDDQQSSFGLAVAIAEAINAELSLAADVERVAMAADARNVIVWVPPFQRGDPAPWIRDIQELSTLMPPTKAQVVIDSDTGTIVVSGDARISPVAVSQRGLTVTVLDPPPSDPTPQLTSKSFIGVTTEENINTKVTDLLEALNQLNVPIEDRIAILKQMSRAGKLHAELVTKE